MSETDSFIEEVSEEVRRDKLFALMRRYGWIAIVFVVVIVGAAAWSEWSRSRAEAEAQALGDALVAAMETEDAGDRVAALAALEVDGPGAAVATLLTASEQIEAGDTEAALATLDALANNADVPATYRELAQIKRLIAGAGILDEEERRAGLETLAVPGQTFRMPALEQLALSTLAAGDTEGAIEQFQLLMEDAEASQGLRDRAEGLIVALGGGAAADDVAGAQPDDTATEEETVAEEDEAADQ